MNSDAPYLFDNEAAESGDRFEALASLFDSVTVQHLEMLGIT